MNSPFKITFDASRGLRMMAQWDISCNWSNYFCHCVQWKKVWNKVIRNRRGRRSLLLKWKEMYRLQKLNDDFLDNLIKGSPTCIFILFFSMPQVLEKCPIFYPIFKIFAGGLSPPRPPLLTVKHRLSTQHRLRYPRLTSPYGD